MSQRLNIFSVCLYIIDFLRVILSLFRFTDLVLFFTYTLNCWHAMSMIYSVLSFHCLHHLNCNYLVSHIWVRVFETSSGIGYSRTIACIQPIKFWAARQNSVARNFPAGIQEVEAPKFQDNRHMKVVRLLALRTGRLYPPGNIPGTYFC